MVQSQSQKCTVLVSGFHSEQKLGVMRKQYRLCQCVSLGGFHNQQDFAGM